MYISIYLLFLTLGKSNDGSYFFAINCTLCPFRVYSTTSTILSIWVTPTALTFYNSGIPCSPWGTQPATTIGFFIFFALQTMLINAVCDGLTTVQLLISTKSASSGLSTILYPYSESCPTMNSLSEMLWEQPKVFTKILWVPGVFSPYINSILT